MQIASAPRTATYQPLPSNLPKPARLAEVEIDDPRVTKAFDNPHLDDAEINGELAGEGSWPMDFIYSPFITHRSGGTDFLATVAAAAKLASSEFGDGITAIMQGRDGAYYLADDLSAGFRGDGGGDWELSSGDLASVTVANVPEVVALVDTGGWFDLRA